MSKDNIQKGYESFKPEGPPTGLRAEFRIGGKTITLRDQETFQLVHNFHDFAGNDSGKRCPNEEVIASVSPTYDPKIVIARLNCTTIRTGPLVGMKSQCYFYIDSNTPARQNPV